VVAIDAASDLETVVIKTDPHRYDWQEVDGNWLLVDKFEPDALTAENFFALIGRIIHQPFYHENKDTTIAGIKKKSLRVYFTQQRAQNG
jgi:hypothetical protein